MTLQEKIEVLNGVKDHPNKEKLVFKIDDAWVSYSELDDQLGFEISNQDSFCYTIEMSKEEAVKKYGSSILSREITVILNQL